MRRSLRLSLAALVAVGGVSLYPLVAFGIEMSRDDRVTIPTPEQSVTVTEDHLDYGGEVLRAVAWVRAVEGARLVEYAAAVERGQREAAAAAERARASLTTTSAATRSRSYDVANIPDSYWDRMAACETGGDWGMTGSRFSGGVGFYNGTWDSFGGREFAPLAGQASRAEQIIVANRVAADVGLTGWGCLKVVGYP